MFGNLACLALSDFSLLKCLRSGDGRYQNHNFLSWLMLSKRRGLSVRLYQCLWSACTSKLSRFWLYRLVINSGEPEEVSCIVHVPLALKRKKTKKTRKNRTRKVLPKAQLACSALICVFQDFSISGLSGCINKFLKAKKLFVVQSNTNKSLSLHLPQRLL